MKKVLVVDDDRDLSEVIESILQLNGYEVILAHDSEGGIRMAEEQTPDLIIMDVMLPGMMGGDAVKILKSKIALKDTPVIFLTGLVSHEEDLNVDGAHYRTLAKPFENDRLLEVIRAIF